MAAQTTKEKERPPVIAIMGHIDHGKSTLLDYIRKSNVVASEAGGITQRVSAYEVIHITKDKKEHKITFLDTPGHEAFGAIRARGANVADIAVLVVSAEDGVKPQTIEALKTIKDAQIPYIVAINKIDKESSDIERTKSSLVENEIYVEGFGGNIPAVPISAKTGQGISELLDMMILVAELEDLKANPEIPAEGIVIEANRDKRKGILSTLIIKNGTLKTGMTVVAGTALSSVRSMENYFGEQINVASFSSPIRIIGWDDLPLVGSIFKSFENKKDAEAYATNLKNIAASLKKNVAEIDNDETTLIPIVMKASEVGGLEAIQHEIKKIKTERVRIKIIHSGVGEITENDIKIGSGRSQTIVVGFNTKIDGPATSLAEKLGIEIKTFDIIYELAAWLELMIKERTPKISIDEATGSAKVVRTFSRTKDKQILGGRVEKGELVLGAEVKIIRRDFEIGKGKIKELQRFKNKADSVPEGQEFGALIESKFEIAPGDRLESFKVIEK